MEKAVARGGGRFVISLFMHVQFNATARLQDIFVFVKMFTVSDQASKESLILRVVAKRHDRLHIAP